MNFSKQDIDNAILVLNATIPRDYKFDKKGRPFYVEKINGRKVVHRVKGVRTP